MGELKNNNRTVKGKKAELLEYFKTFT